MARTQAADYEERRQAIVERAADLFAEHGFPGASMADLGKACGMSKSLVYHYYKSKEDILFDVMHSHVKALLDEAEAIAASGATAPEKLRRMTRRFVELYVGAASRQRVLLNDLDYLPAAQRKVILATQHRLIAIVEEILVSMRRGLSGGNPLKAPAAMLYFGMINWMHTWLDPKGPAEPARIAELAGNIFLDGIEKARIPMR